MTTVAQATAIALALPGAERGRHIGNVDFRVRNKVFATFPAPDRMTLRLDPEHARALIAADPMTYIAHAGVWGDRGWIRVTLSRIALDELSDLVHKSWVRLAPKRSQADCSC